MPLRDVGRESNEFAPAATISGRVSSFHYARGFFSRSDAHGSMTATDKSSTERERSLHQNAPEYFKRPAEEEDLHSFRYNLPAERCRLLDGHIFWSALEACPNWKTWNFGPTLT